MAKSAEIDDPLLGDAKSDVTFRKSAGLADITNGRCELYPTHWAQYGDLSFGFYFHC